MTLDETIGRRLKLKDLQTLMTVFEAGGIGKAADRLNYSQSAVSKAIAGLERTVGKRLLERGRNGVELTSYGNALLKCGAAVFDDLRKGIADIEFLSDPKSGEVRIGCTEPVSAGLVSAVINQLARKYPRIVFYVEMENPTAIRRDLGARKLDFAITQGSLAPIPEEHLQTETLYDDPVVIIAGARHSASNKRRIKLTDIVDESWVLPPPGSFISSLVGDAFRAEGLPPPRTAVITHSAYWRATLASSGHFLTVVPAIMLKVGLRELPVKTLPVQLRGNRRPVEIVTLKNRALSPVAQLFIEHARTVAKTMVKS